MLCAAIVSVAATGCSEAIGDVPDAGQADVAADVYAFAEAALGDAVEEAPTPETQLAGCSAAAYQHGPGPGPAAAMVMALMLAAARKRR
jgi:uncharacterized protein (TIGR03382 family)